MSVPTKIAALLAALRPEGFDGLAPVERRRFADICRHWARIAESGRIDGEQSGDVGGFRVSEGTCMIILTQASDGGTGIFLALFIAIGLFALAAWGTHWIWYFRSFGMFLRGNVVLSARYFLGVIGLVVPIVGIIHGVAIWVGKGARVGNDPGTTFDDLPIEQQASDLRRRMLLFSAGIIVCAGMTAYELAQVEYGGAEGATVWAPLAGLYNALGFWPAVLFFPALGLFGITPMAIKLRAVNAKRAMLT